MLAAGVKETKLSKVHRFIKDNPGKPQWWVAYSLGFRPSKKINSQIYTLKENGKIHKKKEGWYPTIKADRLTETNGNKILAVLTDIPKSRKQIISEVNDKEITYHQIIKYLDTLVKDGKAQKRKTNMLDQRQVGYYILEVFPYV